MDVTKTRLQVLGKSAVNGVKPSIAGVFRDIVAKDGIKGLYAGCVPPSVVIIRQHLLHEGHWRASPLLNIFLSLPTTARSPLFLLLSCLPFNDETARLPSTTSAENVAH
jgi:hypothetical protein